MVATLFYFLPILLRRLLVPVVPVFVIPSVLDYIRQVLLFDPVAVMAVGVIIKLSFFGAVLAVNMLVPEPVADCMYGVNTN